MMFAIVAILYMIAGEIALTYGNWNVRVFTVEEGDDEGPYDTDRIVE